MEKTLQTLDALEREGVIMDTLTPETARLLAAKEQRRKQLARLPYPEKVRMVVQLQRMAAPILRARGRAVRIWQLESEQGQ